VRRVLAAGHTPTAVVVSRDGSTLYVCNRFDNQVSILNLETGEETARIPAVREPVSAVLSANGRHLFVANQVPLGPADANFVAAQVTVMDVERKEVVAQISLANGSTGVREVSLSPDGRHVYVTHILGRYHLPTTQLERGWVITNALSIIDAEELKLVNTVLLDNIDSGAANPWGVAVTRDGQFIGVTHSGTHELSVIDRVKLHEKLDRVGRGERVSEVSMRPEDVPNDLAFVVGIRRRIPLEGNGPRGMVFVGNKAYVAEYYTGSLGVVEIDPENRRRARSISLGEEPEMDIVRRGEKLFHDAQYTFQTWLSCTSCHPTHGRPDALNWDLLNDGIGNPKNTRSLVSSHQIKPVMSLGVRADAETAVRAGIRFIQFTVRPDDHADAIDEYLKALEPVPSPHLVNGEFSEAARRGARVFRNRCAGCHTPPLYTNAESYNIGTGKGMDEDLPFMTPTLLEIWRTGPYLHDGRATTMDEMLTTFNPDDRHGRTSDLTTGQLRDLVEFVLSL
jgi:YVTN family beta-propeller protein